MRRSSLATAAALAMLLGLALGTRVEAWPRGGGPGGGPGLERAVESLDLDADTRAAVRAVLDAARPAMREMHDNLRSAHEAMRALLAQPDASDEAIRTQADQITALETSFHKLRLDTLLQVRAKLSPEQRTALAEALPGPGHRCGGHRRGGPGGPPPGGQG